MRDDDEIRRAAMEVLLRELGPAETLRFLALASPVKGRDSVKVHRAWQAKLKKGELFDKLFGKG